MHGTDAKARLTTDVCEEKGRNSLTLCMFTPVFTAMGQCPTAVVAKSGFNHTFHCTLNERNCTAVQPNYPLEAQMAESVCVEVFHNGHPFM
jgi:hypothetical protein